MELISDGACPRRPSESYWALPPKDLKLHCFYLNYIEYKLPYHIKHDLSTSSSADFSLEKLAPLQISMAIVIIPLLICLLSLFSLINKSPQSARIRIHLFSISSVW